MLYMAMFLLDRQWLQLQVFIAFNLFAVTFFISVRPFESELLNFLSILNEVIGLVAGYLILPL